MNNNTGHRQKKAGGWTGLQVNFFIPVWRRYSLVAVCAIWSIIEFATGSPIWGLLVGGLGVIAAWQLFFDGWPGTE